MVIRSKHKLDHVIQPPKQRTAPDLEPILARGVWTPSYPSFPKRHQQKVIEQKQAHAGDRVMSTVLLSSLVSFVYLVLLSACFV